MNRGNMKSLLVVVYISSPPDWPIPAFILCQVSFPKLQFSRRAIGIAEYEILHWYRWKPEQSIKQSDSNIQSFSLVVSSGRTLDSYEQIVEGDLTT